MQKIYGSPKRQDGLYQIGRNKWELIYGFGKDDESNDTGWNWRERFTNKPTDAECRETILNTIKADYAERLKNGFEWHGKRVQYTEERKSDFTGLLVAMQGGLLSLPLTMNIGNELHEFTTAEEVSEVAVGLANHKIAVCNAEWAEIDAVSKMTFNENAE